MQHELPPYRGQPGVRFSGTMAVLEREDLDTTGWVCYSLKTDRLLSTVWSVHKSLSTLELPDLDLVYAVFPDSPHVAVSVLHSVGCDIGIASPQGVLKRPAAECGFILDWSADLTKLYLPSTRDGELLLGLFEGTFRYVPIFTDQQAPMDESLIPTVGSFYKTQLASEQVRNFFLQATGAADMGGSGDCFLRSFNYLYHYYTGSPAVSTEAWYKEWGLSSGEYLEDIHINDVANHYGVSIVVSNDVQPDLTTVYGPDGGTPILLHNQWPNHFYAIYRETSEEEPSIVTGVTDPVIPPRPAWHNLVCFLADSDSYIFTDAVNTLQSFRAAHYEVVQMIHALEKESLVPRSEFHKCYYKFRHNVFSDLCRKALGISSPIGTDSPLSVYIDSSRTPDLIIEDDNSIKLIEFTVSNRYDTLDFYKGGGAHQLKYSDEAREIQKKTGKITTVHLLGAVLNQHNLDELCNELIALGGNPVRSILEEFYHICNEDRGIINTSQLTAQQSLVIPDLEVDIKAYERPKLPQTVMVSPEVLQAITDAPDRFRRMSLHILNRTRKSTVLPNLDVAIGSVYLTYHELRKGKKSIGFTGGDFLSQIEKGGSIFLLKHCKLFKEGKSITWSEVQGTVPFTVHYEKHLVLPKAKPPPYTRGNVHNPSQLQSAEYSILISEGYIPIGSINKVFFPPNYLEILSSHDFDNIMHSTSKKMLVNCSFEESDLKECIELYRTEYIRRNTRDHICQPKPTFLIPIPSNYSRCTHPVKNTLLSLLNGKVSGYTGRVLELATELKFAQVRSKEGDDQRIKDLRTKLNFANAELFTCMFEHKIIKRVSEMTDKEKVIIQPFKKASDEALKAYRQGMTDAKGARNENVVHIPRGKNTKYKILFDKEMQHYKSSKNVFRGVGHKEDAADILSFFHNFKNLMNRSAEVVDSPLFHQDRMPGPEILTELKNQYTKRAHDFYMQHFHGRVIDNLLFMLSRIAIHLFNESTKNYNSSYVKVENLGWDNLLVLVKGGSKIYKHQRSRLYKLIMIVEDDLLMPLGISENPNFQVMSTPKGTVVITPWSQLHQDILFDYMSIRERTFMNLFSAYSRCDPTMKEDVPNLLYMPLMLSLHNRRKTEVFMHNCRYLIVNPLAKHANVQGIIESFAGFNYTYLELWLRTQLSLNYEKFASGLMKARTHPRAKIDHLLSNSELRDLWFDEPLINADQLTTFIYITYMMTKAPVNSSLEQATNLWEILEDVDYYSKRHPDVDGLKDHSQRFSILEADDSVYESDFKYDPVFSNYLGHHLASYVQKNIAISELTNKWERIKNQDMDTIANSNGLRGWKNSNFYNKKGYEVVYEKVDEMLKDRPLMSLVEDYLQGSDSTAAASIDKDKNRTELSMEGKNLIFHIVHKIQRGGNREIFCMDLETKSLQNPIEQFLKHICKSIPNEYISIPSNKRHGLIHSDFYERNVTKGVNLTMRWVLDCRRWAPHSVFQKYVYFIEGLAVILPPDFVIFFRKFAEGMFKKKFLTRAHVYSKLQNNIKFAQYKHLMSAASIISDTYEMTVKFSFVMGIFNYLSTLMHSANQMVISEVIRNQCLLNGEGLVILDPKCHSDDSVVSSYHTDPRSRRRSILLYDWLLKGANHMLSIKKSQINDDVYLEFLSVLYLFDRFLPVLPKFASSMPFKPSDKGYSADISFAITQSVEVLTQGGTYEEAFLMMKLTEMFVQKIYRLNYVKGMPYNFLGTIDSHPIEFLYAGGFADLYRTMVYDSDSFWRCYRFLMNSKLLDPEASDISLKWDMSSRITGGPRRILMKYKPILDSLPDDLRWTLSNSKLGNSNLNLLWYVNKLSDRMFYSSLVDEPAPRRFARIFGSGAYRQIRASNGVLYDVPKLGIALTTAVTADELNSSPVDNVAAFLDFCCRDLKGFYDSLEGAAIGDVTVSDTKEKPIVFSQSVGVLGKIDISAVEYVSYTREPRGYRLLGKRSNPYRECERLSTHLRLLGADIENCSNDQLYSLARKLTRDDAKSYRLVMPVPGDSRRVDNYASAILTLSYNSTKWWKIEIRGHRAAVVDWNRKVMHTILPKSVTDFLEVCWFYDTVCKYGIEKLDVFNTDVVALLETTRRDVPPEWKPIVDAEQKPSSVLSEMPYWCCWTQEQVRLGTRWFGSGTCYISVPEAILKLTVSSGEVKEMLIETTHQGSFSKASSWYLSVFISYSGLRFESLPAEMADPGCVYLGFSTEDHIYGIGRPKTFDWVYSMTVLGFSVLPTFSKKTLPFKKIGNNLLYLDYDKEYKVRFFIPLDRPVIVNVSKYMNKEKVQSLVVSNSELNNFLYEVSSSLLGTPKKDKAYLMENISSSLIHNVLFNSSFYQAVMTSFQGIMPLMSALNEWKQNHPGFGFPSKNELEALARQGEVNPLTPKIWDMLQMLGHSRLNKLEFESLIYKVLVLEPDERLSYLLSMYPNLSDQHKIGSLVMVSRSDRIYKSCFMLGKDSHRVFIDLMETISSAMEMGNVKSDILHNYAISLAESRLRTVSHPELLLALVSQVLLDTYDIQLKSSDGIPSVKNIYDVVMELWDEGISQWLNIASSNSATFRTVEFKVDKDLFSDWLIDILDCLAGFAEFQPNRDQSFQTLAGEQRGSIREGKFNSSWAPLKKYISRAEIMWAQGEITLYKQGKKRVGKERKQVPSTKKIVLKKLKEGDPGVVDIEFKPQEEDSLDEYRYSWEYEDESEEIVFDSEAEIEDWAYFSISHMNKRSLKRIRGTAWNIVMACKSFSKDLLNLQDKWSVYVRTTPKPVNLYNLFSGEKYLVMVGRDTKGISVVGYRKMQWQEVMKHVQGGIFRNDKKTEILGKLRSREDILEQPVLLNELQTLDSYFKSMRISDLEKEVEQKELEVKVVKENLYLSPESENMVKELDHLIQSYRRERDAAPDKEEKRKEAVDLESDNDLIAILNKQISLLDSIEESASPEGDEKAMLKLVGVPSQHRFKEEVELLTDGDFRSEFEALFPGYWQKIMRKEISMSRSRKKQRLENARMRIAHMKGDVKNRYTILYGIMSFVLLEVPESGGVKHLSDAFSLDLDDLFCLEEDNLGEDFELAPIYALIPNEYRSLPEDVNRLF
jgi:hypothetical protein